MLIFMSRDLAYAIVMDLEQHEMGNVNDEIHLMSNLHLSKHLLMGGISYVYKSSYKFWNYMTKKSESLL